MEPEKGHDLALAALDKMNIPARLIVAGPGEWYLNGHPSVTLLGFPLHLSPGRVRRAGTPSEGSRLLCGE